MPMSGLSRSPGGSSTYGPSSATAHRSERRWKPPAIIVEAAAQRSDICDDDGVLSLDAGLGLSTDRGQR